MNRENAKLSLSSPRCSPPSPPFSINELWKSGGRGTRKCGPPDPPRCGLPPAALSFAALTARIAALARWAVSFSPRHPPSFFRAFRPRGRPQTRPSTFPVPSARARPSAPLRGERFGPCPRLPYFPASYRLPAPAPASRGEVPVPLLAFPWFSPFPQVSSAIRPCTPVHLPPPANVRPQRRPCPRPESSRFPQPCPVHRSPHRSTYVQLAPKPRKPIPYPLLPDTLTPWTPYA